MHDDSIRKRIIDTATRLYVTNGCHKVSMNDISAEMHISKHTIYQHFENKEELLKECFNNLRQQSDAIISDLRNQIESPIIIMLANFKYITAYSSQLSTLIKDVIIIIPTYTIVYFRLTPTNFRVICIPHSIASNRKDCFVPTSISTKWSTCTALLCIISRPNSILLKPQT